MNLESLVALITNGSALAWLAWEIRQLRSELTEDLNDVRGRVQRIEARCYPRQTCQEVTP